MASDADEPSRSDDDRDERVSLHPLDPREALKALLRTKPDNGGEPNRKRRAKKPAPSEKPSR